MNQNELDKLIKKALILDTQARTLFLDQIEDTIAREKISYLLKDDTEVTEYILKTSAGAKLISPEKIKDLQSGEKINQFIIIKLVAKGGMGAVYLAYDEKLKRNVAIKTIRSKFLHSKTSLVRFKQEAQILSQINHPSICQIYEYISYAGGELLVLEWIDGKTLNDVVLAENEKLQIFIDIASALTAAHEKEIIHRDLKPDNIMLTVKKEVKILDFGIAKSKVTSSKKTTQSLDNNEENVGITRIGTMMGTLLYMSPEQAKGKLVSKSSDIYSLGVIMQEVLTGTCAYRVEDTEDLKSQVENAALINTENLPSNFKQLILSMTALKAENRPSACDLQMKLKAIHEMPLVIKRRRWNFVVVASLMALVGLLLFQAYTNYRSNEQQFFINSYEKEIAKINSKLNFIFTLPKHEIVADLSEMNAFNNTLISQISSNSYLSAKQKNKLIGEALFENRDFKQAIVYLENSWKNGLRTNAIAYKLGFSYQNIYNDNFSSIHSWQMTSQEDDKQLNSESQKKAYKKSVYYYDYFKVNSNDLQWRIEVYKLFFERKYLQALSLINIQELYENADYEMLNFIGIVYLNMRSLALKNKKNETAKAYTQQSMLYFKKSIEYARSYPIPYKNICLLVTDIIENSIFSANKSDIDAFFNEKRYCLEAMQIYPENRELINAYVALNSRYAEHMIEQGGDAKPFLQEALLWSGRVKTKGCKSYGTAGILNDLLAEQQYRDGESPLQSVTNALKSYQNSIRHCPTEITLVTGNMFYSYMILMKELISKGESPLDVMHQAEIKYKEQQESNFKRIDMFGNLNSNYGDLERLVAEFVLSRGGKPIIWLQRAEKSYLESIKTDGPMPYPLGGIAGVKLLQAEYSFSEKSLSLEQLNIVESSINSALKLGENLDWIVLLKADYLALKLKWKFEKGETDSQLFSRAVENYQKVLQMNKKSFQAHLNLAKLYIFGVNLTKSESLKKDYQARAVKEINSILEIKASYFEAKKLQKSLSHNPESKTP